MNTYHVLYKQIIDINQDHTHTRKNQQNYFSHRSYYTLKYAIMNIQNSQEGLGLNQLLVHKNTRSKVKVMDPYATDFRFMTSHIQNTLFCKPLSISVTT